MAGKETVGDLEGALLGMLKGVQGVDFELQGKYKFEELQNNADAL